MTKDEARQVRERRGATAPQVFAVAYVRRNGTGVHRLFVRESAAHKFRARLASYGIPSGLLVAATTWRQVAP